MFGVGLYSLNADYLAYTSSLPELELLEAPEDTIPPRYPVAKTTPEEYQDIVKQSPADLRDPENVKTTIEYDLKTNTYIVRTKLGDMEIGTPMSLTPAEYQDYSMQQSLRSYFRQKNEEEFQKATNKQFNLTDMQFNIGAAERIFGPGGVRVRTQGSAEITMGLKTNKNNDPSLPERSRKRTFFNFDESVQLNVQASVGSKVNFGMNYNTETSFDFDSKKLKLAYTGEEDEIIKSLEAGNVSMNTSNSLINGGAALFGMKADLQFGKLRVNALFAQQESESKTVSSKGGVQTKPFEIKVDKGLAIITEFSGTAEIKDTKKKREVIVTNRETGESKAYLIPYGSRIKITDGQELEAGDELTEGSINPHDLLKIKGVRAVQDYMLQEVQRVYRLQGVEISDKHIEVIVRQMLKKIRIENNGDSEFLPGTLVDVLDFEEMNEKLAEEGKEVAEGKQVLLGITKASLATNSFLSAASFQETTKVLTEAAIKGKIDPLIGLKENVILGKLIPAGTGMKRYGDIKLNTDYNEEIEEQTEDFTEVYEESSDVEAETEDTVSID